MSTTNIFVGNTNNKLRFTSNKLVLAVATSMVLIASSVYLNNPVIQGSESALKANFAGANQQALNTNASQLLSAAPMLFEKNQGQHHSDVRYSARGYNYGISFLSNSVSIQTTDASGNPVNFSMGLDQSNPAPVITGTEQAQAKINYMRGNQSSNWVSNISTYKNVMYQNVYPSIDVVYHGKQKQLEYDFVVKPSANPEDITLSFTGIDSLNISKAGELELSVNGHIVLNHAPVIYQDINNTRHFVSGGYTLLGNNKVGFYVGNYDKSHTLVIDPVVAYAAIVGGSGNDEGIDMAGDDAGNVYLAGHSLSSNAPVSLNALQATHTDISFRDVYVAKLSSDGSLLYATYLGGSGSEEAITVAIDNSGNAYISGRTTSIDFPLVNPIQTARTDISTPNALTKNTTDTFIAKISADGSTLLYSTYFTGDGYDLPRDITVDALGNAYVVGQTNSSDLVTTANAIKANNDDDMRTNSTGIVTYKTSGYIVRINNMGTNFDYISYFGGSEDDYLMGVGLNSAGELIVTGLTRSNDFTLVNAAQLDLNNGLGNSRNYPDAIVAKLQIGATTTNIAFSTYWGGRGVDSTWGSPLIDSNDNIYITGYSRFWSMRLVNAIRSTGESFLAKFDTNGAIIFSTALPGIIGNNLAESPQGDITVAGNHYNNRTFETVDPVQTGQLGTLDGSIVTLTNDGSQILFSSLLGCGGTYGSFGYTSFSGAHYDNAGNLYLGGFSNKGNWANCHPEFATIKHGSPHNRNRNLIVVKIGPTVPSTDLSISMTDTPDPVTEGDNLAYSLAVQNNGASSAPNVILTDTLPASVTLISSTTSQGSCLAAGTVLTCELGEIAVGATATVDVTVIPNTPGGINNTATVSGDYNELSTIDNTVIELTTVEPRNLPPIADAGSDIIKTCTSANSTSVILDASLSSDPDGDVLTYNWNNGVETATTSIATLGFPLGTTTTTLTVSDAEFSVTDTVDVSVLVDVAGLMPPLSGLVVEGNPVILPKKAYKQGRTLPLKLTVGCGSTLLTDLDVSAPNIVAISRSGNAIVLDTIDIDAGAANDNGTAFRYTTNQWMFNLSTADLTTGNYEITIQMPDGQRFVGAFVLR